MSKQCRTCGGKGIVCWYCGSRSEGCLDRGIETRSTPCPDCSPTPEELDICLSSKPKPRQIMIPARWRKNGEGSQLCIQDTEDYTLVIREIEHEAHVGKFSTLIGDRREYFNTIPEAQSAVVRTLGVEG